MRDPKFNNKDGTLTRYALACGYVEKFETHAITVTLWCEAGVPGVYHVRAHNHELGARLFWLTFTSVKNARWHFKNWLKVSQTMLKVE